MDRGVQQIVSPQGDVLVVMPLAHFERLSAAAEPFMLAQPANDGLTDRSSLLPTDVTAALANGESPLAAWRQHRRLSQSSLARKAGVSRFTIMRMEAAGIGAGNRQSRHLIAQALEIPLSAL